MLGYTYNILSDPEKQARRQSLDAVGRKIVWSQLAILTLVCIYRLPPCVRQRPTFFRKLEWRLTRLVSWYSLKSNSLADWAVGGGWLCWMVCLVVWDAGDDFLHLTKAFGMAAAANFPLHVLLSMKRTPFSYIFGLSYEGKLNHMHQGLGNIISLLLSSHVGLYLKFFWDTSRMKTRLLEFDVLCGVAAFVFLGVIVVVSCSWVRRFYYRIFYILHITLSPVLCPLLYFHVSHLRPYLLLSLAFFAYDRLLRALTQVGTTAVIHRLSPDVLHLSISYSKISSLAVPVSHLLITVPGVSAWTKNPFTVADFSQEEGKLHIIARIRNGVTKRLASVAADSDEEPVPIPVVLDMPYGSCMNYTGLASQFGNILIVAGGVGGVFAVPWLKYLANTPGTLERTKFIWVMRDTAAISWAVRSSTAAGIVKEKVEVYITSTASGQEEAEEGVEMQETRLLGENHSDKQEEVVAQLSNWGVRKGKVAFGRPDLDDALKEVSKGGKVAVLVCGPWGLGAGVRKAVGMRIAAGESVWVHVEEFGS